MSKVCSFTSLEFLSNIILLTMIRRQSTDLTTFPRNIEESFVTSIYSNSGHRQKDRQSSFDRIGFVDTCRPNQGLHERESGIKTRKPGALFRPGSHAERSGVGL